MKATGIVRRIDDLGRIVIPKELRRVLEIEIHDSLEIYKDDEYVHLKKYVPGCVFCGSMNNTIMLKEKLVCKNCIDEIIKLEQKS